MDPLSFNIFYSAFSPEKQNPLAIP